MMQLPAPQAPRSKTDAAGMCSRDAKQTGGILQVRHSDCVNQEKG